MGRTINPPPGSIKLIQRGVISIAGGNDTGTATVTPVNTSKALLTLLGAETTVDDTQQLPFLVLTDSDTITAQRSLTTGNQQVAWQLVEYH
jgi:hypothetical protein